MRTTWLPCDTMGNDVEVGDLVVLVRPITNFVKRPKRFGVAQFAIVQNRQFLVAGPDQFRRPDFFKLSDGNNWPRYDVILATALDQYLKSSRAKIVVADRVKVPLHPDRSIHPRNLTGAYVYESTQKAEMDAQNWELFCEVLRREEQAGSGPTDGT